MSDQIAASPPGIIKQLRSGRHPRPLSGIVVTLASGCIAAGLGLGAGSAIETMTQGKWRVLRIPDEEVMWGLIAAGLAWLVFLAWLWTPTLRAKRTGGAGASARGVLLAIVGTVVIGLGIAGGCVWIAHVPMRGDEYAFGAVALIGSGLVLAVWLPLVSRIDRGFIATTAEGTIDVRCPACDHSMAGLYESRCPECGERRTIDDLLNAQR